MAEVILKEEEVIEGEKARWPYTSSYREPSKNGYSFEGWKYNGNFYSKSEYQNEQNNPFGPINGDATISAMWDRMLIKADTNHRLISGDGDTDSDMTKLTGWITSDGGKISGENVSIYDVPLNEGENAIIWDNQNSGVENNKFFVLKKASTNNINQSRYYRFKARTTQYGGMESEVITIKQMGKEQIFLPDFDFITFTCNWGDGRDLDTATFIVGSEIPIGSDGKKLDDYPVGFACRGSQTIDPDYTTNGTSGNAELFAEVSQYIKGGGDNLQSGNESALIKLKNVCDRDLVSQGIYTIYCEIYGNWYGQRVSGDCSLTFSTYKSNSGNGEMKLDRDSENNSLFTFSPVDTNDTQLVSIETIEGNVFAAYSTNSQYVNRTLNGNYYSHIATLEYDVVNKNGVLINRMDNNPTGRNVRFDCTVNDENKNNQGSSAYTFYFTTSSDNLQEQTYVFNRKTLYINEVGSDLNIIAVGNTNTTTINEETIINSIDYSEETDWLDLVSFQMDENGNLYSLKFKNKTINNTDKDRSAEITFYMNKVEEVQCTIWIKITQSKA